VEPQPLPAALAQLRGRLPRKTQMVVAGVESAISLAVRYVPDVTAERRSLARSSCCCLDDRNTNLR
jgi:hypothetical protein